MTTEVHEITRDGKTLRLVARQTVVEYTGRHYSWHGPMVFAGLCQCGHCGRAGMRYLLLAEYASGPILLTHVDPGHVHAVSQDRYRHLLEDSPTDWRRPLVTTKIPWTQPVAGEAGKTDAQRQADWDAKVAAGDVGPWGPGYTEPSLTQDGAETEAEA